MPPKAEEEKKPVRQAHRDNAQNSSTENIELMLKNVFSKFIVKRRFSTDLDQNSLLIPNIRISNFMVA